MEKIPKQAVLYIHRPDTNITCGDCVFVSNGKCRLFIQADNKISASGGSCGLFLKGQNSVIHGDIALITKIEAGYMENPTGFQCKRCEYFNYATMSCSKVDKMSPGDDKGIIHPDACCNLWEADKLRAKMPLDKLNALVQK